MCHDAFGQRQTRGHEECRPVDAVKTNDLFADHLQIGRPVFVKKLAVESTVAECGDVVCERVQPDVDNVLRIVGYGNTPGKCRAADREIPQPGAHERRYFIAPRFRANEIGLLGVQLKKFLLESGELKKIIFFLHRLGGAATLRAGCTRADCVHVKLVKDAVLAGVVALVDKTVVTNTAPESLHAQLVAIGCSADEVVVLQAEPVP